MARSEWQWESINPAPQPDPRHLCALLLSHAINLQFRIYNRPSPPHQHGGHEHRSHQQVYSLNNQIEHRDTCIIITVGFNLTGCADRKQCSGLPDPITVIPAISLFKHVTGTSKQKAFANIFKEQDKLFENNILIAVLDKLIEVFLLKVSLTKHKSIKERRSNQELETKLVSFRQLSETYSFPRNQSKHHASDDLKQRPNHTSVLQPHRSQISQPNKEE